MRHLALLLSSWLPLVLASVTARPAAACDVSIDDRYIVKINGNLADVNAVISSNFVDATHRFSRVFHGFAAKLSHEQRNKLLTNPKVIDMEKDGIVIAHAELGESFEYKEAPSKENPDEEMTIVDPSTGEKTVWQFVPWKDPTSSSDRSNLRVQRQAPWNLARISHRKRRANTYMYDKTAGKGTCVYVLDTGIDTQHPFFEERAFFIKNVVDEDDADDNGHGTLVAGVIGSSMFGVAKETSLFAVKVLNSQGCGRISALLAGMDFVVQDQDAAASQFCPKGVVVNISAGSHRSRSVNEAVLVLQSKGYFVVASAGNDGEDALDFSPASAPEACTVAAIEPDDSFAAYSNYGFGINLLAPGTNITSTAPGGGIKTGSGTSMAAAHVAGLGAYHKSIFTESGDICGYLAGAALEGVVNMEENVPTANLLIHNRLTID